VPELFNENGEKQSVQNGKQINHFKIRDILPDFIIGMEFIFNYQVGLLISIMQIHRISVRQLKLESTKYLTK
jgi:hypothetical protein